MSQLKESRRKSGSKCYLEVPPSALRSRPFTVDDIMHTRITGQHQRWPVDTDTLTRLENLTHDQKDDRRSLLMPVIGLTLLGACLYGFWLLWWSL